MKSSPVRLLSAGVIALLVVISSQAGLARIAPGDPEVRNIVESAENRRDPKRRLVPLHERPERPMLAETTGAQIQPFETRLS